MPTSQPAGATFGARLRALREGKGLSVTALAAAAGLARSYAQDLENDHKCEPGWQVVCRLADALGCRLQDFRGD